MRRLDALGVGLSSLCLLHCLLLPLLIGLLPFGCAWSENESVHHALTWMAVPVAVLALIPAFLRHRRKAVLTLGLTGLAIMVTAPVAGALLEELASTCGGVMLISAHLLNRRYSRPYGCCA